MRRGQSLRASHPRDPRQATQGRREGVPQRRGRGGTGYHSHHKGRGVEGGRHETLESLTPTPAKAMVLENRECSCIVTCARHTEGGKRRGQLQSCRTRR